MTERSVVHATIVLERIYSASPARVFAAWSNKEALLRWGNPGDGWVTSMDRFDFRVGGGETSRFGQPGGETYLNETTYLDIVPDRRIVSSGAVSRGPDRLSVGLLTVEIRPEGEGSRLVLTEQGAFLDGHDLPENHEAGWGSMLDNLGDELARGRAAA